MSSPPLDSDDRLPIMCAMWIDQYCADRLASGDITERTARNFRSYLKVWHDHAGPAQNWTPDIATRWVHDPSVKPNTRRTRLNRLRAYVRWLIRHEILSEDITADISTPRIPQPAPRDLTLNEIRDVFGQVRDQRTMLILLLMVQCGLRSVDVSRVLVEDIDARTRMLAVRAKGGRGDVTHHAAIPAELWTALDAWIGSRSDGPLLVNQRRLSPTPLSPGHIAKLAYEPIRAAGLKARPFDGVSPHAYRHSCAQHMLDHGANIRQVQAQLGHRHQSTTEIYLRRRPDGLAEAVEGRSYLAAA